MSQPTNNVRIRRTQKLLREALIELIEERGFDALTVGELTSRAMVSRAAFYRNYRDKYDLVEQIFEEVMSTMHGAVADIGPEQHPPKVWVKFFEHIAEYERLYRALLGSKGSPWFVRKMRASLADLVKEHERVPDGQPATTRLVLTFADEFVPDLVSAMLVEAITWWLEHGRPYTPREIATRCALLVSTLFKEVSTWQ
ncbi:MAG: TetR/AcrR family transcriptional regulator [Chloroflexota bacterium]